MTLTLFCTLLSAILQVLQHQQLVLEVVQQLSRMFKPDFKLINKRMFTS
jgi:hypothetical protein